MPNVSGNYDYGKICKIAGIKVCIDNTDPEDILVTFPYEMTKEEANQSLIKIDTAIQDNKYSNDEDLGYAIIFREFLKDSQGYHCI